MIEKNIKNFNLAECPKCGYLMKINLLDETAEKKRYDSHVCDEGYIKYMNNVYSYIADFLIEGISIDYGCGKIHALADILKANNRECDYYDLYYYPTQEIKNYSNIILIEVFEHINNPEKALESLLHHLNCNGRIIIMTQLKPDDYSNWWYMRDETHVSFFTRNAFEELSRKFDMKCCFDEKHSLIILERI